MNPKLRTFLEVNNIKTYNYIGNKKWSVTHDNNKLIEMFEDIRKLMPKFKLKPFDEYQTFKEFYESFYERTELEKCGSYTHKYINDSKYTFHNHFLNRELLNSPLNEKYFKFSEMNFWENEKWNFYILDTIKNREIMLYLNNRFNQMIEPEFNYYYAHFKRARAPLATSRFLIERSLYDKEQINIAIKKNRNSYLTDKKIDIDLPINIKELEILDDNKLIDLFYKAKFFNEFTELNQKNKYMVYHQKYSDITFKKFLFKTYEFKEIDRALDIFEWEHSEDDYMTYEKIIEKA